MKVYVIFFSCRTYQEVMGVYNTREKAEKAMQLLHKDRTGSQQLGILILEREVE